MQCALIKLATYSTKRVVVMVNLQHEINVKDGNGSRSQTFENPKLKKISKTVEDDSDSDVG